MKFNPVIWFDIYVQDMARAQKFYEAVFQFNMQNMTDPTDEHLKMVGFPSVDETPDKMFPGTSGSLVEMKGMASGGNSTLVYFTSEDCSIEEKRVEKAGGKLVRPKMSIGQYGFISLAQDTEGNMFGIHSMK